MIGLRCGLNSKAAFQFPYVHVIYLKLLSDCMVTS